MKTLYTLNNSEINKPYDLCIYRYQELKDIILRDSELTEREMQTMFDSQAFHDIEKEYLSMEDINIVIEEVYEYTKNFFYNVVKNRYQILLREYSKANMFFTSAKKRLDPNNKKIIVIDEENDVYQYGMGMKFSMKDMQKQYDEFLPLITKFENELEGINSQEDYVNKYYDFPRNRYYNSENNVSYSDNISLPLPKILTISECMKIDNKLVTISEKYMLFTVLTIEEH